MKYGTTPIRRLAFLLAVSALGGGGPQCPAGETTPITAPLRVSAKGHFFLAPNDRPVFVLADTAWSLVNRLKREEITFYLEHRRAQGFNAVAFVLYAPRNSDISHTPANAYGQFPFALVGGQADATRPLVTPGDDPAKSAEYDYWDHAAFALAETKRLGFYAFVLPCWGNEVVGNTSPGEAVPGKPAQQKFLDRTTARSFGRWLGQRYGAEPHVAWMLGGDRSAVDPTTGADFRPVFAAMAEGLRENSRAALISYHPQKAGLQSGDWFHAEPWLTFNSVQLWPEDQIRVIVRDWNATPAKPTWLFEGRYEGYWKRNYKPEDWGEWQTRQQAWQTVLSGAFGHTYGHELVFGFGVNGARWREYLDTPGARSMTHLARFMRSLDPAISLGRVPDQTLIAGDEGRADRLRSTRITASRLADGTFAMFYAANGRSVRVKLDQLAHGPMSARWFNPRTGQWHASGGETDRQQAFATSITAGPGAGEREFDPPAESGDGNDWVLVLERSPGKETQ